MSEYQQFTTVFRAENAKVLKRNRQPVSCAPCRARKMKCDRRQPCAACVKRNDAGACRFTSAGTGSSNSAPRQEVQMRLRRLEEMVQSLVTSSRGDGESDGRPSSAAQQLQTPTPAESEDLGREPESPLGAEPSVDEVGDEERESTYHGATYWETLLDNIRDMQSCLGQKTPLPTRRHSPVVPQVPEDPDLMFGSLEPITVQDVVDCLPSRQDTERMLALYFNNKFIAHNYIHVHQFQRLYSAFREDPSSTGMLWLSLLLSVLSMTSMIVIKTSVAGLPTITETHQAFFHRKAAQCLIAGEYLKARPFAVEALMAYAHGHSIRSRDSNPVVWSLFGIATRLAQRQGYHRDPAKLNVGAGSGMLPKHLRPFDCEMRRRAWFFIETFDLLFSFQLGMPTIIHESEVDTESPSLLTDDDFDEDTLVLPPPPEPPSSPHAEATTSLYFFYKSRLSRILRRVIRHVLATTRPPFEETMEISRALHAFKDSLPPTLRNRPIRSTSFSDPSHSIMHRLMLEMMYSKSLCVLHRPYLTQQPHPQFRDSKRECRSAALRMIDLLVEFYHERKPGGRLAGDMYELGSLSSHDFLVACMVVCVDLSEGLRDGEEGEEEEAGLREREIGALETARDVWAAKSAAGSRDAARAEAVLRTVLEKLKKERRPRRKKGERSGVHVQEWPLWEGEHAVGCGVSNVSVRSRGGEENGRELGAETVPVEQQTTASTVSGTSIDVGGGAASRVEPGDGETYMFDLGNFVVDDGMDVGALNWSALDQFLVEEDQGGVSCL